MKDKEYNLDRFLKAQELMYPWALREIKNGRKQTHWMWFIFPQLKALGHSHTALYYGIEDLDEAKQYLAHPVLGTRLKEISEALLSLETNDPYKVMGGIDSLKLCSSMTLFAMISEENSVFHQVLQQFYKGKMCVKTLSISMQVNEKEFTRKLMDLSRATMQKISSLATSIDNLHEIHRIVMESKTEQEILTAIAKME